MNDIFHCREPANRHIPKILCKDFKYMIYLLYMLLWLRIRHFCARYYITWFSFTNTLVCHVLFIWSTTCRLATIPRRVVQSHNQNQRTYNRHVSSIWRSTMSTIAISSQRRWTQRNETFSPLSTRNYPNAFILTITRSQPLWHPSVNTKHRRSIPPVHSMNCPFGANCSICRKQSSNWWTNVGKRTPAVQTVLLMPIALPAHAAGSSRWVTIESIPVTSRRQRRYAGGLISVWCS